MMSSQYCKVGNSVPKNSSQTKNKNCEGICNPVPIMGHPSEQCLDCKKSN